MHTSLSHCSEHHSPSSPSNFISSLNPFQALLLCCSLPSSCLSQDVLPPRYRPWGPKGRRRSPCFLGTPSVSRWLQSPAASWQHCNKADATSNLQMLPSSRGGWTLSAVFESGAAFHCSAERGFDEFLM